MNQVVQKMDVTYQEITNQPHSWAATLEWVADHWPSFGVTFEPGVRVLFIGCGTSYNLAQTAARLFQEATGHVSVAVPASEVFLNDESTVPASGPVVAFAISRSGTTSEVLMAVEHLHKKYPNVRTVGVTCNSQKTLAHIAQVAVSLDHASEESVVMTQSFTSMLLAIQWIAASEGNRENLREELGKLPDVLRSSIEEMAAFGKRIGATETADQYIYLGLGAYFGLATEATLKLKEMTQTPCEAYNPLEFRHGPISIVREGTAAVYLVAKDNADYIADVIRDVSAVQGRTIAIAPNSIGSSLGADDFLGIEELSDWSRSVLYMPALQFIAHARALDLGLNPDQPRNLNQVVILKETAAR